MSNLLLRSYSFSVLYCLSRSSSFLTEYIAQKARIMLSFVWCERAMSSRKFVFFQNTEAQVKRADGINEALCGGIGETLYGVIGIGRVPETEHNLLLVESYGSNVSENTRHTMDDTLKLRVLPSTLNYSLKNPLKILVLYLETIKSIHSEKKNEALFNRLYMDDYITMIPFGKTLTCCEALIEATTCGLKQQINSYKSASYQTIKRRKAFGIQVIQDTLTLTETSIIDPTKWRFVEVRSATIPVSWSDRSQIVKLFELVACLHEFVLEQSSVTEQLEAEENGIIEVHEDGQSLLKNHVAVCVSSTRSEQVDSITEEIYQSKALNQNRKAFASGYGIRSLVVKMINLSK
ncbi:uncharacterized protein EV154DRAFT_552597 [Mucor mucedo]|uniref:uncharacterized protein n=1 Tax=Mucor mucedo TaxID=29922 RepID=UPI00221EE648|nr:uncharacterized protein EV154DRAFT_552597 [Mucor mucedo]KAI7890025.1 hypothetical protein EV154DRAFT_552597 [Mucor mucedo]